MHVLKLVEVEATDQGEMVSLSMVILRHKLQVKKTCACCKLFTQLVLHVSHTTATHLIESTASSLVGSSSQISLPISRVQAIMEKGHFISKLNLHF